MNNMLDKICMLDNCVQEYSWGSREFIPNLLGQPSPFPKPMAELWMGTHPKGPSKVFLNGNWQLLEDVIRQAPFSALGKKAVYKFGSNLPFLFKILAANKPLSIQVHPNLKQAKTGFIRENRQKIPPKAENRNYNDTNHKPEILCALTPFDALKGFRTPHQILKYLNRISPLRHETIFDPLKEALVKNDLNFFFTTLMTSSPELKSQMVGQAVLRAKNIFSNDPAFSWILKLNQFYNGDIGVLAPIYLELIHLRPGESIYIPPGQLHAYLDGNAIELMANSDNVIRGGLTSKNIDIKELLDIVDFRIKPLEILTAIHGHTLERTYLTPAAEFCLSGITLEKEQSFISSQHRSVEIMLFSNGNGKIKDMETQESLKVKKGQSIIIPASLLQYQLKGELTLFKASIPI